MMKSNPFSYSLPDGIDKPDHFEALRPLAASNSIVHYCLEAIDQGSVSREVGLAIAVKHLVEQSATLVHELAEQSFSRACNMSLEGLHMSPSPLENHKYRL